MGQEGLQDLTHLGGLAAAPEVAEAYGWAIQEVWEDLVDSLLELLASGEGDILLIRDPFPFYATHLKK